MKRKSKVLPFRSHEEATTESFRNDPEFAAEYLNAVLEIWCLFVIWCLAFGACLIPHPSSLIPQEIDRRSISLLLGGSQGPQDQNLSQEHFTTGVRPRLITSRRTMSRCITSRPIKARIAAAMAADYDVRTREGGSRKAKGGRGNRAELKRARDRCRAAVLAFLNPSVFFLPPFSFRLSNVGRGGRAGRKAGDQPLHSPRPGS